MSRFDIIAVRPRPDLRTRGFIGMQLGISRWHGLSGRCFTADSTRYDEPYEYVMSASWFCICVRCVCIFYSNGQNGAST